MIYRLRFLRRITRRIWRVLRRILRRSFYFSLSLWLCFGSFSVGVSAADDDWVLVGSKFDSGAPFVNDCVNSVNSSYIGKLVCGVIWPDPSFVLSGYSSSLFDVVPSSMVAMGMVDGNRVRWALGQYNNVQRVTSPFWEVNLDDYNLFAGRRYRFQVDELVSRIGVNFPVSAKMVEKIAVSMVSSDGVVMDDVLLVDNQFDVPNHNSPRLKFFGGDVLFYEFEKPELDGVKLHFSVIYLVPSTSNHNDDVASIFNAVANWFGFSGAGIYRGLGDDELWQNEQRGFWQRLWEFLQGMWDAIVSIPEKIGEFFTNLIGALGDWFAQLGQWFADLWEGILQIFEDIKDFFIGLFIPEDGALQALVDDFKLYAEGKLGFVVQIFQLAGTVIGDMMNGGGGDVVLIFPGVKLPAAFGGTQLWQDTPFNLTAMVNSNSAFTTIYTIYKVLASVLLLGLLLRYLYRVASEILGQRDGGGEE